MKSGEKYPVEETRTKNQNAALHKWCRQLAEAYNENGLSWEIILENFTMELYPTMESVKEIIVRTAIQRMFKKNSTTQILKQGEIDKLVDVVTKFNAKMGIEYIPFPNINEGETEEK